MVFFDYPPSSPAKQDEDQEMHEPIASNENQHYDDQEMHVSLSSHEKQHVDQDMREPLSTNENGHNDHGMRKPLSSHENRIEEQEPVKSLTSPNKRRYQQEPDDDSISSSTKRRRVPDDPSSPKNCYDELSDYAPNVSARTRTEHLKQLYAILNDELPYRSTSRSQIDSLDEAVGFIRYLKKKVGAGIEEASEL